MVSLFVIESQIKPINHVSDESFACFLFERERERDKLTFADSLPKWPRPGSGISSGFAHG